jgi:hypothetical protein
MTVVGEREVRQHRDAAEEGRLEGLEQLGAQRLGHEGRRRPARLRIRHSDMIVSVPALVVMMITVLRKSMSRPSPSFIWPLSNTW